MIKVEDLNIKDPISDEFREQIKVELELIDNELQLHPCALGENHVMHELPKIIKVDSKLDKKTLQMILYGEIIKSLKFRQFDVKLFFNPMPRLKIIWQSNIPESYMINIRELLATTLDLSEQKTQNTETDNVKGNKSNQK